MRFRMSRSVSSAAPTTNWVACPTAPFVILGIAFGVGFRLISSIQAIGARMSRS